MRLRVLLPLTLICMLVSGCATFNHEERFGSRDDVPDAAGFGDTNTVVEVPFPVVVVDGTAVAGWLSYVVREEPAGDFAAAVEPDDPVGPYRLASGDKLRIFVYAQPSLSRIYNVDSEGFVSVPLIGNVRAHGMTTRALEGVIASRLGAEFVRDPHVTVDIQQYRPFFILGEVKTAGQYPYVGGLTVNAAVAIAGGFSERANERKVQITRRMKEGVAKLEVPGDTEVRPGDTIYVKERWF